MIGTATRSGNLLRHSRESGNPGSDRRIWVHRFRGNDEEEAWSDADWERALAFFARPRPFLDGSDFVTTDAGTGLVHMAPGPRRG